MRMPQSSALVLLSSLLCLPSALCAQTVWTVEPATTTAVSGYAASRTTQIGFGAGHEAVARIWWGERGDKPCELQIEGKALEYAITTYTRKNFNLCDGGATSAAWSTDGSGRIVEFGSAPDWRYVIMGISVCTNNSNNHRLKGIKIVAGGVPNSAPGLPKTIHHYGVWDRADQTNCATWHRQVSCPTEQIASGLVIHHTNEEITGIALRCRGLR
ncbi:MAG: hypothetical protein IT353_19410 [Gemmatimonadaceae bacterium]|nr:hypothetical protein [Gemmatimonadaceae bacterium]